MQENDSQTFFELLTEMSEYFSDELSEVRQRTYWRHFAACTIDEWAYACDQAMRQETFHKVPLTAALMEYVTEYREEQRRLEFQKQERDALQRQLAAPVGDVIPREELARLVHRLVEQLEMNAPLSAHPELPQVHTRIRGYRLPLDADAIEERKVLLREQAKNIEEQRNGTPSNQR